MIFQQKLLEEAYCFVKMTGPAMVRPVGSDFWKAPLASTSLRRSSSTSLPFLSIRADEFDRTLGTSKLLGTDAEGYKTKEMALRFRDE